MEKKYQQRMNEVGELLSEIFNGAAFILMVTDFDTDVGVMNYISNADRGDVIAALKEFIATQEGRAAAPSSTKH
jgi:hypothetical protein